MDIPQFLQKISNSTLVMPIEENLSPLLPMQNMKLNYIQTCLVNTQIEINDWYPQNADLLDFNDMNLHGGEEDINIF
jgi:hypothetical protein